MKKTITIVCACILVILFIILIPKNVERISNATVNSNNGDIAFCFLDESGRIEKISLVVMNKDGEKLFSKSIISNGCAHLDMLFVDDVLHVYEGRTNKIYSYGRTGNPVDSNVTKDQISSRISFEEWDYSFGKATIVLNGYEYCYKSANIFRRKETLSISNGDTFLLIYESP